MSPPSGQIIRKGFFQRRRDQVRVRRFFCQSCRRSFSVSRYSSDAWQKKRDLNEPIRKLLCSGVSQRRVARLLEIDAKTVSRKLAYLADEARRDHEEGLLREHSLPVPEIQFDEMETFEHTKCKPLSIPLVVCKKSRRILGFSVASMPAGGPLAKIALQKYGPRPDHRGREAKQLLLSLRQSVSSNARIDSDQNPKYPAWVRAAFPEASHVPFKGRRACIVGQGELKKIGFDPLFSLNHTAAMIRANVNRMFRRTWCTTKKANRLAQHLWLYVQFHNRELIGA